MEGDGGLFSLLTEHLLIEEPGECCGSFRKYLCTSEHRFESSYRHKILTLHSGLRSSTHPCENTSFLY